MAARAPRVAGRRADRADAAPRASAAERFRELDEYRVEREWKRYEGNALRDLFRELRERFLSRHAPAAAGPVLEVGPGPGRFSPSLGDREHPRVLLDLSVRALRAARGHLSGRNEARIGASHFVRGDALRPPLRGGGFAQVVALGNALGFAEGRSGELLAAMASQVRPGGQLIVEFVAGEGELSVYARRMPPGALRRALAAPPPALLPRFLREGFVTLPRARRPGHAFRRLGPRELAERLGALGFRTEELVAIAPATGALPPTVEAVRTDPKAWPHLLEIEESLGQRPERLEHAAAVLLCARRADGGGSPASES